MKIGLKVSGLHDLALLPMGISGVQGIHDALPGIDRSLYVVRRADHAN